MNYNLENIIKPEYTSFEKGDSIYIETDGYEGFNIISGIVKRVDTIHKSYIIYDTEDLRDHIVSWSCIRVLKDKCN